MIMPQMLRHIHYTIRLSTLILACFLPFITLAQKSTNTESDAKAIAIADKVIKNMGGTKAWNNTRYLAWTWRGQYHVWDKYENNFRWEKDSVVVISNLNTRQGKAYSNGKEITDEARRKKLIDNMYPTWANNSYWFIMPFKLRDEGVTLKYKGTGTTTAGEDADLIELTFKEVGVTPNNRYVLAVDKKSGLVTEWSFFRNATDEKPSFTRPWTNYETYDKIKLASSRGDASMNMTDIDVLDNVPPGVFNSPTPITKL